MPIRSLDFGTSFEDIISIIPGLSNNNNNDNNINQSSEDFDRENSFATNDETKQSNKEDTEKKI